jgi:5-methylcytosine-specific restriction endonuclease McrA
MTNPRMSEVDMAQDTQTKVCSICAESKPRSEFHRKAAAKDGLGSCCKPCAIAKADAWRRANRDRANEIARNGYERNRVKVREAARKQYHQDPEKYLARSRKWAAANPDYFKTWRADNAEYMAAHYRAKRARRASAPIGEIDLAALWDGVCGICGSELDIDLRFPDPMSKSLDHKIPLARGGSHEQDNLQWAHLICNTRKGARIPD